MDFLGVLFLILFFTFGLCVGSFINVLVYRLPRNLSPLKGRSFCDHCRHQLVWRDNVPLLSFFGLGGKCRYCHFSISWQYPLVELITGVLFLLVYWWVESFCSDFFNCYIVILLYCYLASSLIAVFVIDLKHQIIPDGIIYPAVLISFLTIFFHVSKILPNLFSGIGASLFFLSLVLITKGKGMGGGDVKLAFLMGLILGFPKILVALYFAFLTGAVIGVILILMGKRGMKSSIPFGPFLVSGTFFSLFWGEKIIKMSLKML